MPQAGALCLPHAIPGLACTSPGKVVGIQPPIVAICALIFLLHLKLMFSLALPSIRKRQCPADSENCCRLMLVECYWNLPGSFQETPGNGSSKGQLVGMGRN